MDCHTGFVLVCVVAARLARAQILTSEAPSLHAESSVWNLAQYFSYIYHQNCYYKLARSHVHGTPKRDLLPNVFVRNLLPWLGIVAAAGAHGSLQGPAWETGNR